MERVKQALPVKWVQVVLSVRIGIRLGAVVTSHEEHCWSEQVVLSGFTHEGDQPDGDVNSVEEQRHIAALEQLSRLTRGQEVVDGPPADVDECYEVPLPTRRCLSEEEKAKFERDGFVCCRGWFSAEEVDLLRCTIEADRTATGSYITVVDTEGRDTKLTEWHRFGDDTYSHFGRSASLVRAASELMGRSEPFLSHAKLLLKEPRSGGAWEWHQDFGSVARRCACTQIPRCNQYSQPWM